jgi:hypothetical protein
VVYNIKAGKPYTIRNYNDSIEDPEIAKILESYFKNSQIKPGSNVDVTYFDTERANINEIMLENGYYKFAKDYIFFEVDTFIGNYQADIKITIKNPSKTTENGERIPDKHKQYYFNDVAIYPDYVPASIVKKGTEENVKHDTVPGKGNVTFLIAKKNKYTKAALTRGLTIDKDSLYRASKAKGSFTYYGSLANFRLINFDFYEPETNSGDSGKNYLNSRIKLTPLTPQSFTIELEGNKTSDKFGMASNLLYQHLNLFGGAEILDLKVKAELNNQEAAAVDNGSYFSETEYGATASIRFPTMVAPFNTRNFYLKYFPKTGFSLGYNYRYNSNYKRKILSGSFGYDWRSGSVYTHQLNVLEFSSVKLVIKDSSYLYDLKSSQQLQEKFDHMIVGSSYTFTYNTQKIKKASDFHFLKFKLELAGNLINAFHSALKPEKLGFGEYQREVLQTNGIYTEEQVQHEIDSLNTSRPSFYTIAGIPYSQYVKTEIDFRYYQILNTKNEIVYRINPGIIIPYGNSFYSPQEKRFFLGGASSMRAWQSRILGPGSFSLPDTLKKPYQYGDIKLEMNIEYRFNLFWMIEAAFFADAGNIWSTSKYETDESKKFKLNRFYKEIALGVGTGLRFDFDFFIFRFDFGFKQHDPSLPEGERWLGFDCFQKGNWAFNFGIGYPF